MLSIGLLAAKVWHYWIGFILAVSGVGAILGLIRGYLKKVTALKYPPKR